MSGHCRKCFSVSSNVSLLIVLVLAGLLLIAFFDWQAMRDPRIGSPVVLILRLLETLGILSLCAARWPGSVPALLAVISLVNLNTEVFQIECLLGRPHPTRAALTYVCGIAVALLVLLLFYPLLHLWSRCVRSSHGVSRSLESMCESLMPGNITPGTRLPFTPMQALTAATFKEYIKIALTVRCRKPERGCLGRAALRRDVADG
jgi:hypothetical protein